MNTHPISEVYNMDCMEYMKSVPDKFFELAVVDPPYFDGPNKLGYYGKEISSFGIKRPAYKVKHWGIPLKRFFEELFRVSKEQIVWVVNYYPYGIFSSGRIVWNKVNGKSSFSDCEIAFCSMIDTVRMFTYMWNGMCQGKSLKEGHLQQGDKRKNEKRIHPTQKPVALYAWLLQNYANPGDKILDTHLGSGSSRIAAYKMGFDFYGTEIDKEYFDAQEKRFREECLGEIRLRNGNVYVQKELFEL